MIRIENASFKYQHTEDLSVNSVNLKIKDGEFVVLTGPSGSGKTTVTRLINALIPHFYEGAFEGNVYINEKNTRSSEPHDLFRMMGSVFQNPRSQFFSFDTDSEIVFGMENMGMERDRMVKRHQETIKALGLEELCGKKLFEMSGGQKQRIAFASVWAMDPDIYVLDEPSSNLDEETTDILHDYLKDLKARGKTVIISEHRLYYLSDLLDRLVIVNDGQIKSDISSSELSQMSKEEISELHIRSLSKTELDKPFLTRIPRTSFFGPSNDGNVLEVKDLAIGYTPGHPVAKNISFAVRKGEVIGIKGRNGCGKSTLARTISGLEKKLGGSFRYKGGKPYLVMQDSDYQLYCDSVNEELRRTDKGEDENLRKEVMHKLGLEKYQDRHPLSLSGGQKQRTAIGVEALMNTDVLIFDEPTSGLDLGNMHKVTEIIKDLSIQGKAVLVISHDDEFMKEACDYIYQL